MSKGNLENGKGRVVLFYPKLGSPSLNDIFPLPVLAVAGSLERAGYTPVIIDARFEPDFEEKVVKESENALCVGISAILGVQLREGRRMASVLRQRNPGIPIIWGGWGPSVLAEQAIEDPLVDVVVRGQGETAMLEILERLNDGRDLSGIPGVHSKLDGKLVRNPDRTLEDINNFPGPAYHLVDIERYIKPLSTSLGMDVNGQRKIEYYASQGCPFRCKFCCDVAVYHRCFIALKKERMLDDLKRFVHSYNAEYIAFIDSNFFTSLSRSRELVEGILERGLKFAWSAYGRSNVIIQMDDDILRKTAESGCRKVFLGAESGSQEALDVIRKDINAEDNIIAAKKLDSVGIEASLLLVSGVPGEPEDALDKTIEMISEIARDCASTTFKLYLFYPIPGSPFYEEAIQMGFEKSGTFAEYGNIDRLNPVDFGGRHMQDGKAPWVSSEFVKRVRKIAFYLYLHHITTYKKRNVKKGLKSRLYNYANNLARKRMIKIDYSRPWEYRLFQMLGKFE